MVENCKRLLIFSWNEVWKCLTCCSVVPFQISNRSIEIHLFCWGKNLQFAGKTDFFYYLKYLLWFLSKRKKFLIKNTLRIRKINKNIFFCIFYLISPSNNIFVQSEWSVSRFAKVSTRMHSVQQVQMMKNAFFADISRKMLTSAKQCKFFLMKIKKTYDSCYICNVSCPLHNFFLEILAQANLPNPQPLGYHGKIPSPGIGLIWKMRNNTSEHSFRIFIVLAVHVYHSFCQ